MNAILNKHDEYHWALIAQAIESCTPSIQRALINSPQSKGCHQLIKQGACLVETTAELVEEIAGPLASYGEKYQNLVNTPADKSPPEQLTNEEALLQKILGYEPMLIDELDTPWPMEKLLQLLIALELKGVVVSEQGYYSRV